MKMRPILFSAPMVRAILDGAKTQTRRVVKPQFEPDAEPVEMSAISERGYQISGHSGYWWDDVTANSDVSIRCPYGQPGDRLWVRETWQRRRIAMSSFQLSQGELYTEYLYRADAYDGSPIQSAVRHEELVALKPSDRLKEIWRPSIHMPRAVSRIKLEISGVGVERLQDISEADAQAEGIQPAYGEWRDYRTAPSVNYPVCATGVDSYKTLWESINGNGSWDVNPWVWVVEFKRVETGDA